MIRFFQTAALALATLAFVSAPVMAGTMMPKCKGPVAYAVASSKVYYTKGQSMYGHAKGGAYMCAAAADAKGYKHFTSPAPKATKKPMMKPKPKATKKP
jgi:hypothetical protein